jgi:3-oxoacyl-[acyl-carrier-protein] synthase II
VTVVTGLSTLVFSDKARSDLDPTPWLKQRKSRKFMGLQDELAVVAAGRALEQARLSAAELGERAGLFAAIGDIPFEHDDIAPVLAASLDGAEFSMPRFAAAGYQKAHPLLTFRCLPNMPAYHVSVNFDVQGRYFVSYPGPAQLYSALEEASISLADASVDVALLLAVAHQRNFLVEHHFQRGEPALAPAMLADVGACLVLEREEHAAQRGAALRGRLIDLELAYQPFDPLEGRGPSAGTTMDGLGPATLLVELERALSADTRLFSNQLVSDGIHARSAWQVGA